MILYFIHKHPIVLIKIATSNLWQHNYYEGIMDLNYLWLMLMIISNHLKQYIAIAIAIAMLCRYLRYVKRWHHSIEYHTQDLNIFVVNCSYVKCGSIA